MRRMCAHSMAEPLRIAGSVKGHGILTTCAALDIASMIGYDRHTSETKQHIVGQMVEVVHSALIDCKMTRIYVLLARFLNVLPSRWYRGTVFFAIFKSSILIYIVVCCDVSLAPKKPGRTEERPWSVPVHGGISTPKEP